MDYARALVEHPKWRWEPGMGVKTLHESSSVVTAWHRYYGGHVHACGPTGIGDQEWDPSDLRLDLDHPATKGWLLHMLREATGTQLSTHYDAREEIGDYWYVSGGYSAPTEGEALAAALLAVWGQA